MNTVQGKTVSPVWSELRLPSVQEAGGAPLLKLKKFPETRSSGLKKKMDSSPDTERAECVSTRGGDRSDQGLVANAAGQDCRQASQLRDLLAQIFWQLKTIQTIDFKKKKDMRLGNLIFCQKLK